MPDVAILATVKAAHGDPYFPAAKSGDALSAAALVQHLVGPAELAVVRELVGTGKPTLCPVHALETTGVNEIPVALAVALSHALGLSVETSVIQDNTVGHTGADGWHRLANPALFSGHVSSGSEYVIVDDFIGQGGTIANLAGFIRSNSGKVTAVITLTGHDYSARLAPDLELIQALRRKHGHELELWWQQQFGYDFDCLTQSEARYLARIPHADTVRARILAARQGTGGEAAQGIEDRLG